MRLLGTLLSAGLITVAFPSDSYLVYLSWVCLVPWILSAYKASFWQNFLFGSIITCALIVLPSYTGINNALLLKVMSAGEHLVYLFAFYLPYLPYLPPYILFGWFISYHFHPSLSSLWKNTAFGTLAIILFPTIFPTYPATMLSHQIIAIQLLDIGGTALLQFVQLYINLLVALIILLFYKQKPALKPTIVLVSSLSLVYLYGYFRINTIDNMNPIEQLNVLVVQTNSEENDSVNSLLRNNQHQQVSAWEYTRHAIEKSKEHVDFILWPENPVLLSCSDQHFRKLAKQVKAIKTPILYQCLECEENIDKKSCYTSAQLIDASGEKVALYRKQNLIPAFEYLISDAINEWKDNLFSHHSNTKISPVSPTIEFKEKSMIIPSICYDIHFSANFFKGYQAGGNIIMNMGNDRAFGQSQVAEFDLMMARFRVVEFRLPLVRANNNGFSLVMKPTGEIQQGSLIPMETKEARVSSVKIVKPYSFYATYGNWFLYGLICYFIGLLFIAVIRGKQIETNYFFLSRRKRTL